MARRIRTGRSAQRARFTRAAKRCKGTKGKMNFRACMRRELKK